MGSTSTRWHHADVRACEGDITCPYEGAVADDWPDSSRGRVEAVVNGRHELHIAIRARNGRRRQIVVPVQQVRCQLGTRKDSMAHPCSTDRRVLIMYHFPPQGKPECHTIGSQFDMVLRATCRV